ncbi:MAG TPA: serine/threonine-protein kinase, partial [Kofleriaceae bacterium]|nr:serine/threonine-protein kinase [Kofleriaceae bacterium]
MGDASLGRLVAGRYELVGVLGEGTFGVVYDAVHRVIGRRVAVKLLREEIGRDPELVQRFQLEARAAGALGHPNIVQIFDAGQMENGDGSQFLVMERIDGASLASELAGGPLEIARAIDIAAQVLAGLAAAHRRSIVHRDLKPENILLGRDEEGREIAKIADFGISKVLDPARVGVAGDMRMTGHGEVLGTPLYMAPEQAAGEADIDHRADLWAVGCVLYEMVCGRPPFLGENFPQILAALLRDPPLMPGTLRADVSPALEAVIMRALEKDRTQRPADATAMRSMLLAAASAQPTAVQGQAAAAPASADEAALVAALSRAVALELAAEPPASEPEPVPEIELAPVAAPPPPRPAARAHTPAPDAFAPPDAVDLPVVLDVDRGLLRTSQRRTVVDTPIPARALAPIRRRRLPIAGLVSALLIAGILAGGAFAGYRYLTLGYVWRPGGGVKLELAIVPADAEVTLDGEPLISNRFS